MRLLHLFTPQLCLFFYLDAEWWWLNVLVLLYLEFSLKFVKCRCAQCWLLWWPAACSVGLNGSRLRKGGVKKSTQWMSPLIHFLIKQPAPRRISMPSFSAWAGIVHKSWRALRHCSASLHARTHSPIALNKSMPPLGWTGIISSRWFMMDMGNVFTETTWVTSFSRPENKYRPLYHTIAQASVVLASHHCVSHTSLTPLQGTAHPLCPRCPCEICVRLCNRNRVHLHGNVLAAVKCVYCWNGSCCWRPALSPRKAFSWPIHLYLRYFPTSTFGTWFLLWLQQL